MKGTMGFGVWRRGDSSLKLEQKWWDRGLGWTAREREEMEKIIWVGEFYPLCFIYVCVCVCVLNLF